MSQYGLSASFHLFCPLPGAGDALEATMILVSVVSSFQWAMATIQLAIYRLREFERRAQADENKVASRKWREG
jgi:hypothetical protein